MSVLKRMFQILIYLAGLTLVLLLIVRFVDYLMIKGFYSFFFQHLRGLTDWPDQLIGAASIALSAVAYLALPTLIFALLLRRKKVIMWGAVIVASAMVVIYYASQPAEGQWFNPFTGRSMFKYVEYPDGYAVACPLGYAVDPVYGMKLEPLTTAVVKKYDTKLIRLSDYQNLKKFKQSPANSKNEQSKEAAPASDKYELKKPPPQNESATANSGKEARKPPPKLEIVQKIVDQNPEGWSDFNKNDEIAPYIGNAMLRVESVETKPEGTFVNIACKMKDGSPGYLLTLRDKYKNCYLVDQDGTSYNFHTESPIGYYYKASLDLHQYIDLKKSTNNGSIPNNYYGVYQSCWTIRKNETVRLRLEFEPLKPNAQVLTLHHPQFQPLTMINVPHPPSLDSPSSKETQYDFLPLGASQLPEKGWTCGTGVYRHILMRVEKSRTNNLLTTLWVVCRTRDNQLGCMIIPQSGNTYLVDDEGSGYSLIRCVPYGAYETLNLSMTFLEKLRYRENGWETDMMHWQIRKDEILKLELSFEPISSSAKTVTMYYPRFQPLTSITAGRN